MPATRGKNRSRGSDKVVAGRPQRTRGSSKRPAGVATDPHRVWPEVSGGAMSDLCCLNAIPVGLRVPAVETNGSKSKYGAISNVPTNPMIRRERAR